MFSPRLALASLSGESDAAWATQAAEWAGAAFLGGICLDDRSRRAARQMVRSRDREEFLPEDPLDFIDTELAALEGVPLRPAFNVRSTTIEPVAAASAICASHGALIEINAHCRQDELCAVGCGETLLADTDRLCAFVDRAASAGAPVSVKVRAEVEGVDLVDTARRVHRAGAAVLHVDAMDTEPVIREIDQALDDRPFLIANNGVRDRATAHEYLRHGADAVSVGRPSDRPAILSAVKTAVDAWFQETPA